MMKAVNFLEWFKEYPQNLNSLKDKNDFKLAEMCLFYSQTFKPDMITGFFEGFYTTSINNVVCINFETSNEAFKDRAFWKVTFYSGSHIEYENVFGKRAIIDFPQTLNDFISDCQRAGIELTWKPKIENKYFN